MLVMALVAGFSLSCTTSARLKSQAKISEADAQKTALAKVPGTVKESELEKEKGRLVWEFEIVPTGANDLTEVVVDALTGEVVSVQK